jgi:hypothetical protein
MVARVAAWMCAWATLAVVGGCGKADGGAEPIPQNELPARIASLLCNSMAGCCKSSGFPLDTAACQTAYTAELQEDLADDVSPRVRYDAQAAGDCLAAVSGTIQCGQVEEDDVGACERIFVGSVAVGQPCESNRECARVSGRSVYCESSDGVSPSVCTASPSSAAARGKAGDACFTTCDGADDCSFAVAPVPIGPGDAPTPQPDPVVCYKTDGLFCDAGACAPLRTAGQPCDSSEACRDPDSCNFNTGVCTPPQPNGSACESDSGCESRNCSDAPPAQDPGTVTAQVCVSARTVTAEQCQRASATESTDSTTPGEDTTDPGSSAGAP